MRTATAADGKVVAVKTYDHRAAKANACVARHMATEEALAGKIDHEHIIAPRAVHRRPGRTDLVMSFASGGNLGQHLKKNHVSESEARRIFSQLVDAVSYLHGKGIVHRDIKLENVLMDSDANAHLADFGAARVGTGSELLASMQGTPAYMAPEVASGQRYKGPPADVWSLGVLLYNLLVNGEFPFWGKNLDELKRNIARSTPTLPPNLSPSCRDLLRKILVKSAAQRMTIADVKKHAWLRGCEAPDDRRPGTAPLTAIGVGLGSPRSVKHLR